LIMESPSHPIRFTLIYDGEEHQIATRWGEYRDLKMLIEDMFFPEDFGQCGGMGRCATCMVEIEGLNGESALMKRNEASTLKKFVPGRGAVRLSCQIAVDGSLANTRVKILENV
jgi:2Fe-2S ferredoxin